MSSPFTGADADIPLPRLRTIQSLWTLAAVLAGLGVAALAIDVPLARLVEAGYCPASLKKIFALSEVFSHGLGVVMIVLVIGVLDPWHRYALPRILAAALGSGIVANVFKLLVSRTRPNHFDLQYSGLESFSGWLPWWSGPSWQQGFPSSHLATAAGLAIVLACFYPRGRWLFPALAVLAGGQRIVVEAHFLSDVFWGAAIGCVFAPLCVYGSSLARWFDRLEGNILVAAGRIHRPFAPHCDFSKRPAETQAEPDVHRAA
jgi:membrane-associated phospholipid phosphatase